MSTRIKRGGPPARRRPESSNICVVFGLPETPPTGEETIAEARKVLAGHPNEVWFWEQYRPGDTVRWYENFPAPLCGSAGYVLERDGRPIADITVVVS